VARQPAKRAGPHRGRQSPDFERIALVLQGGGALGSYQAGVYQALWEAGIEPNWVAGISIGAINSALIAGSPPAMRVERLRAFWETVSEPPLGVAYQPWLKLEDEGLRQAVNRMRALGVLLWGAPNFFTPRPAWQTMFQQETPATVSFYDVAPLRGLLETLVDFDLINRQTVRFSVGAVNVRTGNFIYFDNKTHTIRPEHVIASGSLPPGFPATEVDGEFYWDGGLVSNTPLQWVVGDHPRHDTLAFQVDLWNARGELPRDLVASDVRAKEIRYSSRTRAATDNFRRSQALRRAAAKLLDKIPEALRQTPEAELLHSEADDKVYNIIQMIYHSKNYEGSSKDYEFSRRTMEEHWLEGYNDGVRTLEYPDVLKRPDNPEGFVTFDLARAEGSDR
jgi:NTE family protein